MPGICPQIFDRLDKAALGQQFGRRLTPAPNPISVSARPHTAARPVLQPISGHKRGPRAAQCRGMPDLATNSRPRTAPRQCCDRAFSAARARVMNTTISNCARPPRRGRPFTESHSASSRSTFCRRISGVFFADGRQRPGAVRRFVRRRPAPGAGAGHNSANICPQI